MWFLLGTSVSESLSSAQCLEFMAFGYTGSEARLRFKGFVQGPTYRPMQTPKARVRGIGPPGARFTTQN